MKSLVLFTLGATVSLLVHASDDSSRQAPATMSTQELTRADVAGQITATDTLSPWIQPGEVAIPNPDYLPTRPLDVPAAVAVAPEWMPDVAPWNSIN
jgi:hypothetical protein